MCTRRSDGREFVLVARCTPPGRHSCRQDQGRASGVRAAAGQPDFCRRYPSSFSSTRPLRVLFLGQVNLRKGVEPLLDAIRLLGSEPIEFTFVGPVQISIPADLRDNRQVRWQGAAPRLATSQFYKDADVFLFPTFSDGFGLTQLEAQAWKLPIITTQFCGEVVEHGRNGWILPEITPQSIAEILRECLRDPSRLQAASDRSGVDERFDLVQSGTRMDECVRMNVPGAMIVQRCRRLVNCRDHLTGRLACNENIKWRLSPSCHRRISGISLAPSLPEKR